MIRKKRYASSSSNKNPKPISWGLDYLQGFDLKCDVFLNFPITKDVYPAVIYIVSRLFPHPPLYPMLYSGKGETELGGWYDPNEILKEIIEPLKGEEPKIQIVKIFFLDKKTVNFWDKRRPKRKLNFDELLDYIDQLRTKDIHKKITNIDNIDNSVENLTEFLKFIEVQAYGEHRTNKSSLEDLIILLFNCNQLLRKGKIFPDDTLEALNDVKYFVWEEDWLHKRKLGKIPERVTRKIKHAESFDTKSFLLTLFRDLLKDVKENSSLASCGNKYCHKIFQPIKSKPGQKYCCPQCADREQQHVKYKLWPDKMKEKSKEYRRKAKEIPIVRPPTNILKIT